MAGRILRLSSTFRRSVERLGVLAGSPAYHAVSASIRALNTTEDLPGAGDYETSFTLGRAHVRRVTAYNLWLLYRFDDAQLFVLTTRNQPPIPD